MEARTISSDSINYKIQKQGLWRKTYNALIEFSISISLVYLQRYLAIKRLYYTELLVFIGCLSTYDSFMGNTC